MEIHGSGNVVPWTRLVPNRVSVNFALSHQWMKSFNPHNPNAETLFVDFCCKNPEQRH